jgi:hypothetical protein
MPRQSCRDSNVNQDENAPKLDGRHAPANSVIRRSTPASVTVFSSRSCEVLHTITCKLQALPRSLHFAADLPMKAPSHDCCRCCPVFLDWLSCRRRIQRRHREQPVWSLGESQFVRLRGRTLQRRGAKRSSSDDLVLARSNAVANRCAPSDRKVIHWRRPTAEMSFHETIVGVVIVNPPAA